MTGDQARALAVAFAGAVLLGVILALLTPPPRDSVPEPGPPGPAPAEVTALLREAEQIVRDAG